MIQKRHTPNQQGFTIVELLIATTVLSTILLIVTIVMVGIGNLYYKGVNQSRVQGNVRSLTDEISQKLQLSDGKSWHSTSSVNTQAYCIGATRYSYALNRQINTGQHVLWRDTIRDATHCAVADNFLVAASPSDADTAPSSVGTELIAPHSRLTTFRITQATSTDPYVVSVGVAYGDDDLLCNSTNGNDCNVDTNDPAHINGLLNPASPYDIICRARDGKQFCATGALQTTVVKRYSST